MKKTLLIKLFVFISLILSSCGNNEKKMEPKVELEKEQSDLIVLPYDTTLPGIEGIKNTIKAYNLTVINAQLSDQYVDEVRRYATVKETQRVFMNINIDSQQGLIMKSRQEDIVYDNISASESGAFADTYETWNYEYLNLETKEIVEPKKQIRYNIKYILERENNKWVIAKIEEIKPTVMIKTLTPEEVEKLRKK